MQKKERRMFERIEDTVDVKYRARKAGLEEVGSVKDIGGGGIRLALAEKLGLGSVLDLEITIPDDSKPFSAKGEVVWTKEISIRGDSVARYHDTGIKFVEIDPVCLGRVFAYFYQHK